MFCSGKYTLDDFLCYLPEQNKFIFVPSGADQMWPGQNVCLVVRGAPVVDDDLLALGQTGEDAYKRDESGNVVHKSAVDEIVHDKDRRVSGMTWWPGKPAVIRDTVIRAQGGVIRTEGMNTFNRYKAPHLIIGKHPPVEMWLDLIQMLYPTDWQHMVKWFAHRVQHPDIKILHALVLGGPTRIGKDTLLKPVIYAIGNWNHQPTDAQTIMDDPKNSGYLEAVICIINEARDFGDSDRFAFYERMKPWIGGVAGGVLMVADKYIRRHPVIDVVGFVITTNHKARGLYLPPDDARHYVAWCYLTRADIGERFGYAVSDDPKVQDELGLKYYAPLYDWYASGGYEAVAEYLMTLDITDFSPTAPPPRTKAFFDIVHAYEDPAENALARILEKLGNPAAVSVREVGEADEFSELDWIGKSRNKIPGDFELMKMSPVRNPDSKKGRWQVDTHAGSRREVSIYAKDKLDRKEQLRAAREVMEREEKLAAKP